MIFFNEILISGIVMIVIAISVSIFCFAKIDSKWCRDSYMEFVETKLEESINKIEALFLKYSLIIGGIAGLVLGIIFDLLFQISLFWGGILLPVGIGIVGVIGGVIVGTLLCNEYCVKHFGKMIAFVEMIGNASFLKEKFAPNDDEVKFTGESYGDQYLKRLGTGLNREISIAIWLFRIIGMIIGFAIGAVVGSLIASDKGILFLFLLELVGIAFFLFEADRRGKQFCLVHYGQLCLNYQLHLDIRAVRRNFISDEEIAENSSENDSDSEKIKDDTEKTSLVGENQNNNENLENAHAEFDSSKNSTE